MSLSDALLMKLCVCVCMVACVGGVQRALKAKAGDEGMNKFVNWQTPRHVVRVIYPPTYVFWAPNGSGPIYIR